MRENDAQSAEKKQENMIKPGSKASRDLQKFAPKRLQENTKQNLHAKHINTVKTTGMYTHVAVSVVHGGKWSSG